MTPEECARAWGCTNRTCMGKGQSTDVIVDETADVIVSHAATVDMISAMQPKEIWIDVEVVRADGTREPIETIKGEVVL